MMRLASPWQESSPRPVAGPCDRAIDRHMSTMERQLDLPVRDGAVRLTEVDHRALSSAVLSLENPGLAARLTSLAGTPVEMMGKMLPPGASGIISAAVTKGLDAALAVA